MRIKEVLKGRRREGMKGWRKEKEVGGRER
jgi:hypothetical protein